MRASNLVQRAIIERLGRADGGECDERLGHERWLKHMGEFQRLLSDDDDGSFRALVLAQDAEGILDRLGIGKE